MCLACKIVANNVESTALSKTSSGASVSSESPPEVKEVEGRDTWCTSQGGIGVQGEFTQVEKVERTSGTSLLWW